jgi:hypothetical protein
MSRRNVTIIEFPTIYAPGYSKERLEREDADRFIGHARHQVLFDRMVLTHDRWERVQGRSFFILLTCFPEVAVWGWLLHKTTNVLVLIIVQFIFSCISIWNAGTKMEACEGPLEG